MTDASATAGSLTRPRGVAADVRFLIQVSRPGLWSTTALFYLLPLGHADFAHSRRLWLGLTFILFPVGLLLYGVNDLADAEADQLNPRKGTYMFGSRGAPDQLAALKWQIVVAQLPFFAAFYWLTGPRILWSYAILLTPWRYFLAGGAATPRKTRTARLRRRRSSSARRPTSVPIFVLGTVVILSTIKRHGARSPLAALGWMRSRKSGASVGSVVKSQTVTEEVLSKRSS